MHPLQSGTVKVITSGKKHSMTGKAASRSGMLSLQKPVLNATAAGVQNLKHVLCEFSRDMASAPESQDLLNISLTDLDKRM